LIFEEFHKEKVPFFSIPKTLADQEFTPLYPCFWNARAYPPLLRVAVRAESPALPESPYQWLGDNKTNTKEVMALWHFKVKFHVKYTFSAK